MDYQTALVRFLNLTQDAYNKSFGADYERMKEHNCVRTFCIVKGSKYDKIKGDPGGVHCFVKKDDGTIWKAASWSAPAKNFPRGNIFDENPTISIYGY